MLDLYYIVTYDSRRNERGRFIVADSTAEKAAERVREYLPPDEKIDRITRIYNGVTHPTFMEL